METTLFGVKGLALRKITRNEGETNGQADEKWHGNGCCIHLFRGFVLNC